MSAAQPRKNSHPVNTEDPSVQEQVNRRVYEKRGTYKHYLSTSLRLSEAACFHEHRSHIAGRDILDIGVGAGRTTHHLAPLARRYEAIDYSADMVDYLKKAMPHISVRQADFRDLGMFDHASFDFIFASNNVIDALSHQGRLQALNESCRVLRPGGILAFSCHNINYKDAGASPRLQWSWNPARLAINGARFLRSYRNYLRVKPLRQVTPEYALFNDPGEYYACLHYYAARATVKAQLAESGLRVINVFDGLGQLMPEHRDDSDNPSLLYTAERAFR